MYRPNTFTNIVGQDHIVTTLQNTIAQHKIGHAYLFHGPRGTGKTSIAKIFAAAVNCTADNHMAKPCHACENCALIDSGQATDIIELDAASNSGVDEIRQIREFVRYAPSHLPYKVYIIDEVHMLSTAAFNALLKTLEEPPAHVIFVLATTEIHKIPTTIISRCQRFDFKKVSKENIIAGIAPILQQEQIMMQQEALAYLAEYADGGMRDALSVLDQVRAYTTGTIELQHVHDVIGTVGSEVYVTLMHAVEHKDVSTLLKLIDQVVASGKNVQLFIEGFLKYLLRELEMSLTGSGLATPKTLLQMIEQMNKVAGGMRTAFLPQVALQAGFLELVYTQNAQENEKTKIATNEKDAATFHAITNEKDKLDMAYKLDQEVSETIGVSEQAQQMEQFVGMVNEGRNIEQSVQVRAQEQGSIIDEQTTIEATTDVLDLYNADNFANNEVVDAQTGLAAPELVTEKQSVTPIKDEALARESLGRAMDEAIAKMKTVEIPVINEMSTEALPQSGEKTQQSLMPASSQVVNDGLQASTDSATVEDLSVPREHKQEEEQLSLSGSLVAGQERTVQANTMAETEQDVAKSTEQNLEAAQQEQHRLLLWRSMVEVVLYPECNTIDKIKRKWQTLKFDPRHQIVAMLLDTEPKIATKDYIVLSSFNKALTNQLQMPSNRVAAETFIAGLVGATYRIVVVDEGSWMRERNQFSTDWKANNISETTLDMLTTKLLPLEKQLGEQAYAHAALNLSEKINSSPDQEDEPIVKAAIDLFGADIVEVKEKK